MTVSRVGSRHSSWPRLGPVCGRMPMRMSWASKWRSTLRIVPNLSNWSNTIRTLSAGLFIGVEFVPAVRRADIPDRRSLEDLPAADLVQQSLPHPPAQDVQLGLGHDPSEPEQEPVVVVDRVIQAVLITQQGAKHRAKLKQLVPVLARAGEPAHLQAEDQPDVIESDFCKEALKAESPFGCGPTLPLIVVDDEDPIGRPAELGGPVGEGVLTVGRFPVLGHLLGGGLADVNDGQAVKVPGLDLARESESDA